MASFVLIDRTSNNQNQHRIWGSLRSSNHGGGDLARLDQIVVTARIEVDKGGVKGEHVGPDYLDHNSGVITSERPFAF